jgi:hypothetical protein
VKYSRIHGDKVHLGRVELDFTPEWVPDSALPNARAAARGETADATDVRKIAVPRVRLSVRGSDTVFEIRDRERIQRLRKMIGSRRMETLDAR